MRLGILMTLALIPLVLASCKGAPPTSPGVIAKEPTRLYWGDTHLAHQLLGRRVFPEEPLRGSRHRVPMGAGASGRASIDAIARADPYSARFPRRGRPRGDAGGSGLKLMQGDPASAATATGRQVDGDDAGGEGRRRCSSTSSALRSTATQRSRTSRRRASNGRHGATSSMRRTRHNVPVCVYFVDRLGVDLHARRQQPSPRRLHAGRRGEGAGSSSRSAPSTATNPKTSGHGSKRPASGSARTSWRFPTTRTSVGA